MIPLSDALTMTQKRQQLVVAASGIMICILPEFLSYSAFTQRIAQQSCAFIGRISSTDWRFLKGYELSASGATFTRVLSWKVKAVFSSDIQ